MKKLLLIVLISRFIFSQGLIPHIETNDDGDITKISYYKESHIVLDDNMIETLEIVKEKGYHYGQIKYSVNYKNQQYHGKAARYHENGKIRTKGNWKNGKRDGITTHYHANGQIKKEANYKNGELDGRWTIYDENGQIQAEGNYKDGKAIE